MYFYAVLVVIIIILYYIASWNTNTYEDYLYGFWTAAGDDFCEESDIESMMVFIGEPEISRSSRTRTCYIIIMNDLSAQGFTLEYKSSWASIGSRKYEICADVLFDDEQIWPTKVNISVDMRVGIMKIYRDGVIYAKINKQHDITNQCRTIEGAELVE